MYWARTVNIMLELACVRPLECVEGDVQCLRNGVNLNFTKPNGGCRRIFHPRNVCRILLLQPVVVSPQDVLRVKEPVFRIMGGLISFPKDVVILLCVLVRVPFTDELAAGLVG